MASCGTKTKLIERLKRHDVEIVTLLFTELAPENIYFVENLIEARYQGIVINLWNHFV